VTAVVVGAAAWFATDRSHGDGLGESVAAIESSSEPPSWLFSLTAGAGTYTSGADGTGMLTLTDVDPHVTAFTDRPDRDTAIVPASKLVEAWPALFAESAPNAVLVEHDPGGETDSFVLELSDPTADGSTMTYRARVVIGEDHSEELPGLTSTPSESPPATFSTVSLFIDDVLMEHVDTR
jgi:hypothetical protein